MWLPHGIITSETLDIQKLFLVKTAKDEHFRVGARTESTQEWDNSYVSVF